MCFVLCCVVPVRSGVLSVCFSKRAATDSASIRVCLFWLSGPSRACEMCQTAVLLAADLARWSSLPLPLPLP